ncbi:hypothetical protein JAAARDRAFT_120492 [Jaapia argillacea MUCL 33604]|uniref:Aminodeoxychorismate lyase n=1 Tax=Jaapia argillacea MUCL 33604 TaxID=933084 RepID=A0A067QKH2_9AGAM|nr:hypothetical protein JAAARDRAFT_120492 [Jaapia argillacea MUCL 33604]
MDLNLITSTRFDPEHIVDGSCYWFLQYHLDRLRDAAERHGWDDAKRSLTMDDLDLECERAISEFIDSDRATPFKIRVLLSQSGVLSATASKTRQISPTSHPSTSPLFTFIPLTSDPSPYSPYVQLYLDTQPTPPSIFTQTKTTNRRHYDDARSRAGLPRLTTSSASVTSSSSSAGKGSPNGSPIDMDVILYTPSNLLMESSIRNIALFRNNRWVTPSTTSTGCLPGVMRRYFLEQGKIFEADDAEIRTQDLKEDEWVVVFNGVEGVRLGRVARL